MFQRGQTAHGEELPYIFGIPLDGPKYHFIDRYTEQEQLLSEVMMTYWTNFAYEGYALCMHLNKAMSNATIFLETQTYPKRMDL